MSRSDNRLPKSGKQQFLLLRLHNHLVLRLQNQKISKNRAKVKVCTLAAQASGWEVHIMIILLCEVDDLVYTVDPTLVAQLEQKLIARWNFSQSEALKSFLGINIHYDKTRGVMHFDVAEKIKKIFEFEERPWLKDIGWSDTPMDTKN